jgi:lipoprotein-anchoring transpeptidase ErfK/SrfK
MTRVGGLGVSVAAGPPEAFGADNFLSHRAPFSNSFWRMAVVTAVAATGTASSANAALFYWSDSDPGFSRPAPAVPQVRQKPRHRQGKKIEATEKESSKPQGPLIVAISIERQTLRVYDANGFFAQTPISTGMRGHPTPMGVFSVIQKQKFHRSNIYSGAPMPYMQRITWSGIAMHAGVLPGYPASHGCIRMPMAFAVKMWNWTKMGARVVVTPGEMNPVSFSHPLLVTRKIAPQPIAANDPKTDAPAAATADKATDAGVATTPLRDETHTADAGALPPSPKAAVTMSDASSGRQALPRTEAADASNVEAKSEDAKSGAETTRAKPGETASAGSKPIDTESSGTATSEIKSSKTDTPAANIEAATDASTSVPDVKKNPAASPDTEKATTAKHDPAVAAAPKRTGQVAVLVSRKDAKLYVRQNFAPLFDVPIAIAPSDRPLGTHVFTAQADKDDANVLHWSVVSLPVPTRNAERHDEDERVSRQRKMSGAVEIKATVVPDSPAEALDRLTIPADAIARITETLSTGGSIIVSDQGITAGETGEGTDFIVSLR